MEVVALPWIKEADYPAVHALIRGLPPTFKGWLEQHTAVAAFVQERGGAPEIPITPDDLHRHLQMTDQPANAVALWALAAFLFEQTFCHRDHWHSISQVPVGQ